MTESKTASVCTAHAPLALRALPSMCPPHTNTLYVFPLNSATKRYPVLLRRELHDGAFACAMLMVNLTDEQVKTYSEPANEVSHDEAICTTYDIDTDADDLSKLLYKVAAHPEDEADRHKFYLDAAPDLEKYLVGHKDPMFCVTSYMNDPIDTEDEDDL